MAVIAESENHAEGGIGAPKQSMVSSSYWQEVDA